MAEELPKMFNMQAMDEQTLGCIEFVLTSPAYVDVFEPYLLGVRNYLNTALLDRSQKRKDEFNDDFLAGGIVTIDGLVAFFHHLIEETRMERVHGAMENMTNDMLYDIRRQRGDMKPVVGLDQSAEPSKYNPDEDY